MEDPSVQASPTAEDGGGSSSSGTQLVPVAAVLCICLTAFLIAVLVLLCIRKIMLRRGLKGPGQCCEGGGERWCAAGDNREGCCVGGGGGGCGWCQEMCVEAAEQLDCNGPDSQACLDSVCPSKQACSVWCGQLWSCYGCHMIREQCRNVSCELCPGCAAFECPDCTCCGQCCHCHLKAPECSHITCLCCDLDCGGTES